MVKAKYLRRVLKVLEKVVTGGNINKGINTRVVSPLIYYVLFIDWNCTEFTKLDRRTRNLLTMHNVLHLKSNIYRL